MKEDILKNVGNQNVNFSLNYPFNWK